MTMQTLYWRRDYYKRVYYKWAAWQQPVLTSDEDTSGIVVTASSYGTGENPYKALDGVKSGTGTGSNAKFWGSYGEMTGWWKAVFPYKLKITGLVHYNRYEGNTAAIRGIKGQFYADTNHSVAIGSIIDTPNTNWYATTVSGIPSEGIITDTVLFQKNDDNLYSGIGELEIIARNASVSTSADYDFYEDSPADETNYNYYRDTRVNADEEYTYTTEAEILDTRKGPNLRFGIRHFGKFAFAAPTNIVDEGGGDLPDDKINYLPGIHAVIAYNKDGTKTAIFGAGSERDSIESMNFELVETGCGKVEITFRKLPTNAELNYRQRIDIHLFNDSRPWYSGYIITRPIPGTSDTNAYKFTGHGYYNLLDKVLIFKTYENVEVSNIVVDIARQVENKVGLTFNGNKIINTSYVISKIEFNGVTAKEALKQLTDFAIDYVYGVDEYRQLYFMPRNNEINEQARFWVGMHIGPYSPSWNVDKIVNRAYIKGGNVDDEGEQWLGMVEDANSQAEYGIQEAVWSLPSAYSTDDATRWGQNQIEKYKEPVKSAKVQAVKLEYPKPDGSFFVRKLSTQGQAAITDLEGNRHDYPITKLKYTISGKDGIKLDMELGEQPFAVDKYFAHLDRDAKMAELLQQAATKQLKTGG